MEKVILKNIIKSYKNKTILNNFSLVVQDGDFIGITGASGKGKSTLLNIIGLLEKFEGELIIDNILINNINEKIRRKIMREKIGYLFQNYALIDDLSVYDNLKIVMKRDKVNNLIFKMENALLEVGLEKEHLYQKIFELSGGEQQRVAIARLILKNCEIILSDEPTGSLDRENGKKIMELLNDLNQQGKTIIMVTHDEKNLSYCNKIITL